MARKVRRGLRGTITLPDGRVFPEHGGEALAWDIGSYHTINEERAGFPRMRAVIRAMKTDRPDQLRRECHEYLMASSGRMFGHNAAKTLRVLRDEGACPHLGAMTWLGRARRRKKPVRR